MNYWLVVRKLMLDLLAEYNEADFEAQDEEIEKRQRILNIYDKDRLIEANVCDAVAILEGKNDINKNLDKFYKKCQTIYSKNSPRITEFEFNQCA